MKRRFILRTSQLTTDRAKHEFLWRVNLILGQAPHTVSPNERHSEISPKECPKNIPPRRVSNQGCFELKVILTFIRNKIL